MEKLKYMQTFMLVVEERSITQAACRRLGIQKFLPNKARLLIDILTKKNNF